jgi:hypothetical protein
VTPALAMFHAGFISANEARALQEKLCFRDVVPVPPRPGISIWSCRYCGGSEPHVGERGIVTVKCTRCGAPRAINKERKLR